MQMCKGSLDFLSSLKLRGFMPLIKRTLAHQDD